MVYNFLDLYFAGDFDMMTGDTIHMYQVADADAELDQNQLGSNVKINDPVKMYLKEIVDALNCLLMILGI